MRDRGLRSQQLVLPGVATAHHPQPPNHASRTPWPKVQTHVQDHTQSNAPDRTSGQMRAAEGVNRKGV